MNGNRIDWAAMAKLPKFVELHRKKKTFLLTLWCFGSVCFYLLPICAGYFPEIMRIRVMGRLNVCYIFCLFEFAVVCGIAICYTRRSNAYFDPLSSDVLREIAQEAEK